MPPERITVKALLVLLMLGVAFAFSWVAWSAVVWSAALQPGQPEYSVVPGIPATAIATPTAVASVQPASTSQAPSTSTPTSTGTPVATPTPTATPESTVSEVAPAIQPPPASPRPTPARGWRDLPVPQGTKLIRGGCASDGECYSFNFYWAPTRDVVVQHGEGKPKIMHELCHAHQHWSINRGADLAPADYDLESWYSTAEGRSFTAAVAGLSWPWSHSAINGLEDFAWTCTYWYIDEDYLQEMSPARYQWAQANLP